METEHFSFIEVWSEDPPNSHIPCKRWQDAPRGWYTFREDVDLFTGPFSEEKQAQEFLTSIMNTMWGPAADSEYLYKD